MELKIGTVLARVMRERRLSVKELSKTSGVPVSTIHEWINGRSPRDPLQAKKVADALQISLNRLLFDTPDLTESINLNQILKEDVFSGVFEINIKRVKVKE